MRKTNEEFLAEIKDRPFIALDAYTRAKDKIRFRCDVDGYEWASTPDNVLRGRGCPKCSYRIRGENLKGHNVIIEDHDTWLLIDISTPKFPEATMAVDAEVFAEHTNSGGGRIYAVKGEYSKYIYAFCRTERDRPQRFHHSVLNPQSGFEIDHKTHGSRNFIDNRKSNLRHLNPSENRMNCGVRSNSTSGITGVCWNNRVEKWQAQIRVNKRQINLGLFDNIDFAIGARQQAEREYFGEFAYSANN